MSSNNIHIFYNEMQHWFISCSGTSLHCQQKVIYSTVQWSTVCQVFGSEAAPILWFHDLHLWKWKCHFVTWIQDRHSLLEHMQWGEETSFLSQVPQNHCHPTWLTVLSFSKSLISMSAPLPALPYCAEMVLRQMQCSPPWCLPHQNVDRVLSQLCSGERSTALGGKHH